MMTSGYCTTMCNGRDCGTNESSYHQPQQSCSSSKEGDDVYMVGLENSSLWWTPSEKPNN